MNPPHPCPAPAPAPASAPATARARGQLRDMTDQRIRILTLAANGHTTRDIARHMHLAPDTVNEHMQHIYRFLGARDRAHAVALGIRHGYIPLTAVASRPPRPRRETPAVTGA